MTQGNAGPPTEPPGRRSNRRTKIAVTAGAVVLVAIIAVVVFAFVGWPERAGRQQVVLPFTGLSNASAVAVDNARNVYVVDADTNRVLKLAVGATTQTEPLFTGLDQPKGVAVDSAGNVYVTDYRRVLKLAAGATTQTELPFTGLDHRYFVAVDTGGNVYVTDRSKRVLKLAAG